MCLAIPVEVTRVGPGECEVRVGSSVQTARTDLCPGVRPGDWVLVHAGFVIQRVDRDEAARTIEEIERCGLLGP